MQNGFSPEQKMSQPFVRQVSKLGHRTRPCPKVTTFAEQRQTDRNTGPAAQAPMATVSVTSLAEVLKECVSAVRFVLESPPPSLIVVWCICRIRRKKNGEREVKERDEESE